MSLKKDFKLKVNELDKLCKKLYPEHQNGFDAINEFANSLVNATKIRLLELLNENKGRNSIDKDSLKFLQAIITEAKTRINFNNPSFDIDEMIIVRKESELDQNKGYAKAEIKDMHYYFMKYVPHFQESIINAANEELEKAFLEIEKCDNFDDIYDIVEKYKEIFDELEEKIDYDL